MMTGRTGWYGVNDYREADRKVPRLIYFHGNLFYPGASGDDPRRDFADGALRRAPEFPVRISADGRYKLFVNGTFVQAGPLKGDDKVRFYDERDISPWLIPGENRIEITLLNYPADKNYGNHSIFRSGEPRLYFCPQIEWETFIDRSVSFPPEEDGFSPLIIHEAHTGAAPGDLWQPAVDLPFDSLPEILRPENLEPRDIPFAVKIPHAFDLPVMEIPAHSEKTFVLDAGEEMCAYLSLALAGGEGSSLDILYSECYTGDGFRTHREDAAHGHLKGYHDRYQVSGSADEVFQPFWFRTFRFIQVRIRTAGAPLLLRSFTYEETGYPLKAKKPASFPDETMEKIWDISLRTLKRCMHDTYMDCPFYEQLPYIMDTRSEILYTYAVSGDDRLARHAIRDFSRAMRPCGLLNCSYPNVNDNIIPGFSLYYILMVHDHMRYFRDKELITEVLPVIKDILQYFQENTGEDGLVKKTGGMNLESPLWSFIDWAEPWMATTGMPEAGLHGPLTMESLLYIMGLEAAADLCEFADETQTESLPAITPKTQAVKKQDPARLTEAQRYRLQADAVRAAIRRHCMDADGMITDGPGRSELSQHGQVFGVLSGVLSEEEGKRNLIKAIEDPAITRCTVAMMFYLFRALEKTGLYETYTDRYWDLWRQMIADGCTTCIEGENYARSECHAWGALALYEMR